MCGTSMRWDSTQATTRALASVAPVAGAHNLQCQLQWCTRLLRGDVRTNQLRIEIEGSLARFGRQHAAAGLLRPGGRWARRRQDEAGESHERPPSADVYSARAPPGSLPHAIIHAASYALLRPGPTPTGSEERALHAARRVAHSHRRLLQEVHPASESGGRTSARSSSTLRWMIRIHTYGLQCARGHRGSSGRPSLRSSVDAFCYASPSA